MSKEEIQNTRKRKNIDIDETSIKKQKYYNNFNKLPQDVVMEIIENGNLPVKDVVRLSLINKDMNYLLHKQLKEKICKLKILGVKSMLKNPEDVIIYLESLYNPRNNKAILYFYNPNHNQYSDKKIKIRFLILFKEKYFIHEYFRVKEHGMTFVSKKNKLENKNLRSGLSKEDIKIYLKTSMFKGDLYFDTISNKKKGGDFNFAKDVDSEYFKKTFKMNYEKTFYFTVSEKESNVEKKDFYFFISLENVVLSDRSLNKFCSVFDLK